MARFIYSPDYYCDVGAHVFRTEKYRLLYERLIREGLVKPDEVLRPGPAGRGDLELVHTRAYLDDLFAGRNTQRTMASEMPLTREIADAFALGAGGTILACRTAVQERTFAMNLAGGFHHAFPDWAEGFCYINDVAVGVAVVLRDGLARSPMVVDCDLHQGNGTAFIFRGVPEVFTFSIHEEAIYPLKRHSSLDVGLPSFCPGERYLNELLHHLERAFSRHRPDFALYLAGADPYQGDQLGTLMLSLDDLRRRDAFVLGLCAEHGVPAAVVLAGGYAPTVEETVQIHLQTAEEMVRLSP